MPPAPDEDIEPALNGDLTLIDRVCLRGMVVSIEDDQARQAGLRTAALAKIGQCACWPTPSKNDGMSLDRAG